MSLLERMMKSGVVKASVLSESDFFNDRDRVTTDIPSLNIALGGELDGAITGGLLMVCGHSKSFKTSISLKMVSSYMKKHNDSVCLFYDAEYGSIPDTFKTFGIDTDRVVHIPIENIEELTFDLVDRIKDITRKDKVIIFIDSIGNLASKKEAEDAAEAKSTTDMSRAKKLKSMWRITTPMFNVRDIPCIAINHIYMEQGAMYPKAIVSGGSGGILSSNAIWIISKTQEKEGTDVIGFTFHINIEKSRTVKEKSKIPLTVTFDGGINKYSGILDLALESGHVIKPSNGWYQLVDKETGEISGSKVRMADTQNDEFIGKVLSSPSFSKFIKEKYQLNAKLLNQIAKDDNNESEDDELIQV